LETKAHAIQSTRLVESLLLVREIVERSCIALK
jgi:hypothetical protein